MRIGDWVQTFALPIFTPLDGREDLDVTASFTAADSDSGPDPLEWVVDWGDGTCTPTCAGGTPTWSAGTGGAGTASHTYTDPGRYPVSLNVTDGQDLRKVTQWVNVREDVDTVAAELGRPSCRESECQYV